MHLQSAREVSVELLIAIYRAVSSDCEPSVISEPISSLNYILGALKELVGVSLDHIEPRELLQNNDRHLYDLAEIFLGLLDIVDEEYSKLESDDTDDLCQIDSGNTFNLEQTPSEFFLEPPQCPFSPIFDVTQEGFRTKFPDIVNSSFSGSEVVSVDMPVDPDQKDSSRSHKDSSRSAKTDSTKSLMQKIESKIHQSKFQSEDSFKPKVVTKNLTASDIEWTETGHSSGLNKINSNNSSNKHSTADCGIDDQSEISDVIGDINDDVENITLTTNDEYDDGSGEQVDESDSMKLLLLSLQKTVDNSKRVREEYAKQKKAYDLSRSSSNDTAALCLSSEREQLFKNKSKQKTRRRRPSNRKKPEEEFKKVLEREKQLEQLKQELLVDEFKGQLQDIEDRAVKTQEDLVNEVSCQTSPRQAVPAPSARVETKDLPSQNEIFKPSEKIIQPRLEIGEGDMLKTIMDEMPGLDYDQRTLKQLCDKQDKQTLLLTKEQQQYNQKIKNKDNKIVDVRKRQLLMSKIGSKEQAAEQRVDKIRKNKENENRLSKDIKLKRQKNARIKRYFEEYQTGLKKSLTAKKTQEEQMLRRIFEDGLRIQKNRLRELRQYAKEMRGDEEKVRKQELESIEQFYKDKFDMLADDMKQQKAVIKVNQDEGKKRLRSVKTELSKRLENEIKEMQDAIVKENESMFFRDLEQERLMNQIQVAKFTQKMNRASKL